MRVMAEGGSGLCIGWSQKALVRNSSQSKDLKIIGRQLHRCLRKSVSGSGRFRARTQAGVCWTWACGNMTSVSSVESVRKSHRCQQMLRDPMCFVGDHENSLLHSEWDVGSLLKESFMKRSSVTQPWCKKRVYWDYNVRPQGQTGKFKILFLYNKLHNRL